MKLKELSTEQKNRLLAELDDDKPILLFDHTGNFTLNYFVEGEQFMRQKKRYDLSYDSIIPLVQKLRELDGCKSIKNRYVKFLHIVADKINNKSTLDEINLVVKSTPSQLCDYVLVAAEKAEL